VLDERLGELARAQLGGEGSSDAEHLDPLCGWGRLSNGHGALVRCLTATEAVALSTAGGTPLKLAAPPSPDGDSTSNDHLPISASADAVIFEGERLLEAKSRLAVFNSTYARCVLLHGGLIRGVGEVRIRFRVRARGDTSDASVSRRRVVTTEAARCVADEVNRRAVGVPSTGGTVGTLVLRFSRRSE
jgi:hypothetical protein